MIKQNLLLGSDKLQDANTSIGNTITKHFLIKVFKWFIIPL